MTDPRVSVSAVSSWAWSLDEDLAFWARAGIDHVGLSMRKLEDAGLDAAITRVEADGCRVSNIVELGWWDLADRSTWARQIERLLAAVEVARRLGGCLVLTTGPARGMTWDVAAATLQEALGPVHTAAVAAGVPLTIENTSALRLDLSFVTTWRDTVDLARLLGAGGCLEVNSCFAERGLDEAIAASTDVLRHVQVNDFVIGSLCTPDRAVPGDGDVPLRVILGAIVATGYAGVFEIEMVGPRIDAEGYESAITRAVTYLDRLLAELPAE